ncbi:MAG: hypothetical protein ACE5ES_04125 [Candidatus Nanoarchaeia archaeon]
MNFQFYVEKLNHSDSFKDFIKENPKAYPCSGFFTIDLENIQKPDNKQHIDFFLPEKKEIVSFQLENECKIVPVENFDKEGKFKFEKISLDNNFEFGEIESLILDEMEKQKIKNKIQKIILSLQNKEGRDYFIGTIFISGFGLVKVRIDLKEMKITDFEKKSFMDMVNVFKKKKEN